MAALLTLTTAARGDVVWAAEQVPRTHPDLPGTPGTPVRLLGWGLTVFPPPPSATPPALLQEQDTARLSATMCEGGFIGAGEGRFGGGACYGDSGGPALRRVTGTQAGAPAAWASVGIASRVAGNTCGTSVYTDPTYARSGCGSSPRSSPGRSYRAPAHRAVWTRRAMRGWACSNSSTSGNPRKPQPRSGPSE
jgi:Trypsin